MDIPVINSETNIVENVIVLNDLNDLPPEEGYFYGPEGGQIGWIWNGETYVNPNPEGVPPDVIE